MIFDVRRFGIKYSIPDIGPFGLYKLTDSGVSIRKKCHVVKETASRGREIVADNKRCQITCPVTWLAWSLQSTAAS